MEFPSSLTQGDPLNWSINLPEYNPVTVSCFVRGQSNPLDLTASPNGDSWDFSISDVQSAAFEPGNYQIQLVIFDPGRKTLGVYKLHVCANFENLTELETRSPEEIELEELNNAIAQLTSKNVAEYYIGIRRVRYNDLDKLHARQNYLRNRIAKIKNKCAVGGRNVGVSFCG